MDEAGISVCLTSIANFSAFLVGSLIPLPAVTAFCQQAAIVVVCNLLMMILCFPSIMADDCRRQHRYNRESGGNRLAPSHNPSPISSYADALSRPRTQVRQLISTCAFDVF